MAAGGKAAAAVAAAVSSTTGEHAAAKRAAAAALLLASPLPPNSALHAAGLDPVLADALVAARAAAVDSHTRVRAAALAWERERAATDALARQLAETEQLLHLPASHGVAANSSGSASRRGGGHIEARPS
jgi:hypothetical protein